jgi:hypothetical protein
MEVWRGVTTSGEVLFLLNMGKGKPGEGVVGLFWMCVGHMGVIYGEELEVIEENSPLYYLVK